MKIILLFVYLYSSLIHYSLEIYYSQSDVVLALKVNADYTSSTNIEFKNVTLFK